MAGRKLSRKPVTTMLRVIPSQFIPLPLLSLLLGSCLTLLPQAIPAQAQIPHSGLILAQRRKVQRLPAVPTLPAVPDNQQELLQLQPMQSVEFNQNQQNSQSYQQVQISQYDQNFERYFVYVESASSQVLDRVRQIEPSAYIRSYNGRNVIQSGVFNRRNNAQQRVEELASRGIYGARIDGFSNTTQVPYTNSDSGNYSQNNNSNYNKPRSSFYYVVVPANSRNVSFMADKIRQNVGQNISVFPRSQPRGPHIAVGPFLQRLEAEQWNSYLRNLGYSNARVYYGK
jgi:hypothetical protein